MATRAALASNDTNPLGCSMAEWQMRVDLAACYRLVHHFGLTDLVYNHITARVPDAPKGAHHILINPYGLRYDEITASSLVKIDLEGRKIDDSPHEINHAGYVIHSAIHGARHDVVCVLHTHSRAGTAVSCLEEGFMAMTQGGYQFYNRIAYHDYEGIALDTDERERLVKDLGHHNAMIMRNHGLITLGSSVGEAFSRIYYLEQACQIQMDVLQTGRPLAKVPHEVAEHTAQQWDTAAEDGGDRRYREWPAYKRMLDQNASDYAT